MSPRKPLWHYPRLLCACLAIFDLVLGGGSIIFPRAYAELFHPELADPPIDLIVRTGFIWLFFCLAQTIAATRKRQGAQVRWFFIVGLLRLMDVPADLAYGVLAQGAPWLSKAALLSAPPINFAMGAYLVYMSDQLRRESA